MKIKVTCFSCGNSKEFLLDEKKVKRWHGGEHIQDVFPELSPGDREMLISKCCEPCFDKMFGEEE